MNHETVNWNTCEHCGKRYAMKHSCKKGVKRKPIRPMSKKKAKEMRIYLKRDPSWKLENPVCCYPGCERPTEDRHHVIGQGIHMNDENYQIPLCREHHILCKEKPKLAEAIGLIKTRTISRKTYV